MFLVNNMSPEEAFHLTGALPSTTIDKMFTNLGRAVLKLEHNMDSALSQVIEDTACLPSEIEDALEELHSRIYDLSGIERPAFLKIHKTLLAAFEELQARMDRACNEALKAEGIVGEVIQLISV